MMRIADLRKIEVRVDVGENDIPKIHLGDSATVEVDAYNNRKFKGIVTQIASSNNGAASSQTVTGTDVTNYKVYISLLPESYQDLMDPSKPKSFPFRPGMSASADIQTKTHENRLAVPINAVTTRDKNDTANSKNYTADKSSTDVNTTGKTNSNSDDLEEVVFVLQKDGTVKKTKVRTDIQDINYIEILGGLNEGDEVITGPYDVVSKTLKTGGKVKVVPKSELFDKKK
jgi:HlyD family secretion protein